VEGQLSEALTQSGTLRFAAAVSGGGALGIALPNSGEEGQMPSQEEADALDDRIRSLFGLLMAVGRCVCVCVCVC